MLVKGIVSYTNIPVPAMLDHVRRAVEKHCHTRQILPTYYFIYMPV